MVLKHVFTREELRRDRGGKDAEENEDRALEVVERDLVEAVEPFGTIEKVTVFSKSEEQVIIVKFKEVRMCEERTACRSEATKRCAYGTFSVRRCAPRNPNPIPNPAFSSLVAGPSRG